MYHNIHGRNMPYSHVPFYLPWYWPGTVQRFDGCPRELPGASGDGRKMERYAADGCLPLSQRTIEANKIPDCGPIDSTCGEEGVGTVSVVDSARKVIEVHPRSVKNSAEMSHNVKARSEEKTEFKSTDSNGNLVDSKDFDKSASSYDSSVLNVDDKNREFGVVSETSCLTRETLVCSTANSSHPVDKVSSGDDAMSRISVDEPKKNILNQQDTRKIVPSGLRDTPTVTNPISTVGNMHCNATSVQPSPSPFTHIAQGNGTVHSPNTRQKHSGEVDSIETSVAITQRSCNQNDNALQRHRSIEPKILQEDQVLYGMPDIQFRGRHPSGQISSFGITQESPRKRRGRRVAMTTSQPNSSSEMQLYRVLQRANLLSYYDTFIAQGGDDVQQLCEAGEDEFLEIMALVGMASKPLHVRRLQKILQEWLTNPSSFSIPDCTTPTPTPGSISASAAAAQQQGYIVHSTSHAGNNNHSSMWSGGSSSSSSVSPPITDNQDTKNPRLSASPSPITTALLDDQIAAIATAAERLARNLPMFPPKELNQKKGINREVTEVMMLTDEDSGRLEKLRKYAAIYGRFDSKRKNDRPMSLHELSVNEASAQLCRFIPALLTRREDLFPLARQVVRDSGYQYSKGHSRTEPHVSSSKKIKLDNSFNTWLIDQLQKPTSTDQNGNKEHQIQEISAEIKELRDKMDEVRSLILEAKERNDTDSLTVLQGRIDNLTSRQLVLLAELEEFTALPDSAPKPKRTPNGVGDEDEYSDSSNIHSGASSPLNLNEPTLSKRLASHLMSQGDGEVDLFEEGLRIAQQYGLADFAEELKELKQQSGEEVPDGEVGKMDGIRQSIENVKSLLDGAQCRNDEVKRNFGENPINLANNRTASKSNASREGDGVTSSGTASELSSVRELESNKTDENQSLINDSPVANSCPVRMVVVPECSNKEPDCVGDARRVSIISSTTPSSSQPAVPNLPPASVSIHGMSTRKLRRPSQSAAM